MKIKYLNCDDKEKLFSFFPHHCNSKTIEGKEYMIDGGCSANDHQYIRTTNGEIKEAEVKSLISEIRKQFEWGQNYDENDNRLEQTKYAKLKDLTTSHILGILSYFTNSKFVRIQPQTNALVSRGWLTVHEIFIQELLYRNESNRTNI